MDKWTRDCFCFTHLLLQAQRFHHGFSVPGPFSCVIFCTVVKDYMKTLEFEVKVRIKRVNVVHIFCLLRLPWDFTVRPKHARLSLFAFRTELHIQNVGSVKFLQKRTKYTESDYSVCALMFFYSVSPNQWYLLQSQ